jgi:hypothetical protein
MMLGSSCLDIVYIASCGYIYQMCSIVLHIYRVGNVKGSHYSLVMKMTKDIESSFCYMLLNFGACVHPTLVGCSPYP